MSLDQKDIEIMERIIYKNNDDVAVAIARSFERLEERIDAAESRMYGRLAEIEDKVEATRHELSDEIGELKGEIRELTRLSVDLEQD